MSANSISNASAAPLDWFHASRDVMALGSKPDVILAADVVWTLDLIEPLVAALVAAAATETLVLLAHQQRSRISDTRLFSLLDKHFRRYVYM